MRTVRLQRDPCIDPSRTSKYRSMDHIQQASITAPARMFMDAFTRHITEPSFTRHQLHHGHRGPAAISSSSTSK